MGAAYDSVYRVLYGGNLSSAHRESALEIPKALVLEKCSWIQCFVLRSDLIGTSSTKSMIRIHEEILRISV